MVEERKTVKMVRGGRHMFSRSRVFCSPRFLGRVTGKKSAAAMRTGSLGTDSSRTSTTPSSMEGKHSRLAALGKLFKPWKWKRKKKSEKFEQTSRTLERKISMRSTKEELIQRGVLMPEKESPTQLDQNHISELNGSVIMEDESENAQEDETSPPPTLHPAIGESYPVILLDGSTDYRHLPDITVLHLPDLDELSPAGTELTLSTLPEPPIPVSEIGPIPPPPMFSNPSPKLCRFLTPDYADRGGEEDEEDEEEVSIPRFMRIPQPDPHIDTSIIEEIPAKEPHLFAVPKKSALKKRDVSSSSSLPMGAAPSINHSYLSTTSLTSNSPTLMPLSQNRPVATVQPSPATSLWSKLRVSKVPVVVSNPQYCSENKENRPCITITRMDDPDETSGDSDSDGDGTILWRDYYGEDEQCRLAAKIARKDSLALKLAQRPDRQELIDKNIIHAQSDQERQETIEAVGKKLIRRLSLRPTPEELEQRNILRNQTPEEMRKEKEQMKKMLIRKLSFRPTIEELKERKIIRFNDYVEVTQAQDYDRRADKPWTRLTPKDKAAIRKELNEFKSMEMQVHEDSRHLTRFHRP